MGGGGRPSGHREGPGELAYGDAVASVRRSGVALKGPMATAIAGGAPSVNVGLRKALELYANLRPVKSVGLCPESCRKVNSAFSLRSHEILFF